MAKGLRRLLILIAVFAVALSLYSCDAKEAELITDFNALTAAINEAKDGDVLYVGDIDCSPSGNIFNSYMSIRLDKSITVKNGKKDGKATFLNGGFILKGSKVAGEKTACRFEGISFDGGADSVTIADFDYAEGNNVPMKAQQALSFVGNVDAYFVDCEFRNYMHENGPVLDIRYGDYTDNPYMLELFGDHSGCRVNINFDRCAVENNSCLYDGGAIFIDSNNNVKLTATDCSFSGNKSGVGEFSRGGGAIYARGATLEIKNSTLSENTANYVYDGMTLPDTDTNKGGALLLENSKLTLVNSTVKANRASLGGGISLTNARADIDGCSFIENNARAFANNPDNTVGPWSNMAQGGAVYVEGISGDTVTFVNCTVKGNTAETAYGGVYGYYTPHEDVSFGTYYIKMLLCDYVGNTAKTEYDYTATEIYPWASHAGDMLANPHLTLYGCYVNDASLDKDFPRNELPSKDNGYNYFSASENTQAKSTAIPTEEAEKQLAERYNGELSDIHVGVNYSEDLYQPKGDSGALLWVIAIGGAVLLAAFAWIFIRRRKALVNDIEKELFPKEEQKPTEEKKIVMTRYTDVEIDRFISLTPETQLLTGRELEVLREVLRGKKQSEVAYYLGIEVSTVKDFNKKIYGKLNVPNKEGLFVKTTETLKNK